MGIIFGMRGQFFAAAMLVAVQGIELKPEPVEPHPYLAALEAQLSGSGGYGTYGYDHNPYALKITHKPEPKPYYAPEPVYKAPEPVYKAPEPVYHAPEPAYS